MWTRYSRLTLSTFLAGATLAILASACGGGDDSSPADPVTNDPDAGAEAEAAAPDDAATDRPSESATDAAPDHAPDSTDDADGDGVPDADDVCPGFDDHADQDEDGLPDGCDDCPTGDNDVDTDGDGFADGCDICPGLDESIDTNGNGVPECRESLKLWLRADRDVLADDGSGGIGGPAADGAAVRSWRDQGVWGAHGQQTDPARMPAFAASALPNGNPAVRFQGAGTVGSNDDTANDDSLDGPFLLQGGNERTIFLVARTTDAANSSLLELNRTASASGSSYRITPELAVRVVNGNSVFANHPLDNGFHILAIQQPNNATTTDIRVWYDGIPIAPSAVAARTIDTGAGGFRIGDGHLLGQAGFTGDVAEVIVYEEGLTDPQRDSVGLMLERKHGLATWYGESPAVLPVYLLAGQSNMVGQGDATQLTSPLSEAQGDIMAWTSDAVGFSPLRWGGGNSPTMFGPELSFGRAVADDDPNAHFVIVKYAVNGTNLAFDWSPSGPVWAGFIASLSTAAQRLDSLGIAYEVRGLLWMQGESDALDPAMADTYAGNLQAFIDNLRVTLATPQLPVFVGRLRATMPSPFDSALSVRTAQENVASLDPNVHIVDTDPLSLWPDEVHYDTAGQIELGQRFAGSVLQHAPP